MPWDTSLGLERRSKVEAHPWVYTASGRNWGLPETHNQVKGSDSTRCLVLRSGSKSHVLKGLLPVFLPLFSWVLCVKPYLFC